MNDTIARLTELERRIRDALRQQMLAQTEAVWSRPARDDSGDTIFALDIAAEEVLLPFCEEWGRQHCFLLVAEGIEPDEGRLFGRPGASGPEFRLLVDPIDGTRGLMYDKRSAWCLAGTAPDKGPATRLSDIDCAVMTELPTTRQATSDRLWAIRGGSAAAERETLTDGEVQSLPLQPSQATDFLHGFATVCNFFQGGKELTSRIEEELFAAERGGWNAGKAEIYTDQYICSGGQLAELALGRDRFVLDIRPWVHRALGVTSSLCSRPYDLCTLLIPQLAGCVVTAPDGSPLDAPVDVSTNVAFVGYANRALADRIQPMLTEILTRHHLVPD